LEASQTLKRNNQMENRESRVSTSFEVRAEDDAVTVEGYAAVFDEDTVIGGQWMERIAPGAFTNAIGRDDVTFLINHEGLPLARTRSGTLELFEDQRGLKMRASLDMRDPDVRSIVPKMQRGDLDKMSFAFIPTRQKWKDVDGKALPRRTIEEAELYDVSIVTTPAYSGTEIGLRSLEDFRKSQRKSQAPRRMRMKDRLQK
jgi:HK97 family phage prohead protease